MDPRFTLTVTEYERLKPLLYHRVDADVQAQMAVQRTEFLLLAVGILRNQSASRSQSLALTHLEETQMRAIQGLALQGEAELPPGFAVEDVKAD